MVTILGWKEHCAKGHTERWTSISRPIYKCLLGVVSVAVMTTTVWEHIPCRLNLLQTSWVFAHFLIRRSTRAVHRLIISRMAAIYWRQLCLEDPLHTIISGVQPSTKLVIGMASCTHFRVRRVIVTETIFLTHLFSPCLRMDVLPQRTPVLTLLDWMPYITLWIIRLMTVIKDLQTTRPTEWGTCGP